MAWTKYYIDGDRGNNTNNGSTPTLAWATIAYALSKIDDGTVSEPDAVIIIMNTTTYTCDTDENNLDTGSNAHVVITGANSEGVVDGTQITIQATGTWNDTAIGLWQSDHKHYTYMNIIFDANDKAEYAWNRGGNAGDDVAFINCRFTNALGWGCYPNNSYFQFYNCEFDNNGNADSDAHGGCYRAYYGHWYRCVFRDNLGIGLYTPGQRSSIDRCVFSNNSRYGLTLYGECRVSDSVFQDNDRGAIYVHGHANYMPAHIINCVFQGNAQESTAIPPIYSGNANYTAMIYNSVFDSQNLGGQIGGITAGPPAVNDRFALFQGNGGSTGGTAVVSFQGSTVDRDFTPTSGSAVVDNGVPSLFVVHGTTAIDAGPITFENTESISVF